MADQLCTTAQVKSRDDVPDAGDDALLSELIDQVSDWIQEYTGRKLVPEAGATYVVDTAAGSIIDVPRGIRTVTSLEIALTDQPDAGGTYTAVTAADVLLRPSSMYRKPGWPATQILIRNPSVGRLAQALNGARITGDFGFAATPPAIQGVAIDAVVAAYTARQGGPDQGIGESSSTIFPWSRYFGAGSPQRAILDRFRAGAAMGIA